MGLSMSQQVVIRQSESADRDEILSFIERMGFNSRDSIIWDGLAMSAMTAWEGKRLIGAIPLEPRIMRWADGRNVAAVHETVVAVDPAYRSSGIGSQMQEMIFRDRPNNAELATVFREEPDSRAYMWYRRNGFEPVMHITSWFCDEPSRIAGGQKSIISGIGDADIPWQKLESLRSSSLVDPQTRPLRKWLSVHPYRQRYDFRVLSLPSVGHVLLGIGSMHSQTVRADILQSFCESDSTSAVTELLGACATVAVENDWRPIRLPLAACDPWSATVKSMGFRAGWPFDILARPLCGQINPSPSLSAEWRYAGIDYC